MWKDVRPAVERFLVLSEVALKNGHLYFAVEELGKAREEARSFAMTQQDPETLKKGLEGFEAAWQKENIELVALDRKAKQRDWTTAPAALRALGESSEGQAITLLEASKAYASVTDPTSGYYYLGAAKANEEFNEFVYSLSVQRKGAQFAPHSIAIPLQELQERTNAAFVPPLSINKHRVFIRLNSMLKVAGELDQADLYSGALYQYMQALTQFSLLQPKAIDQAEKARIHKSIAEARAKLGGDTTDESLVAMFVERAETIVAEKNGKEATEEEWQNAAAVVDSVLPAYYKFVKSHPEEIKQAPNLVTVTLVRWPFT